MSHGRRRRGSQGPVTAGYHDPLQPRRADRVDLEPSAKVAQGFEPQKIATVDGRTYEGFIVRESGDEVELRDVQGSATVLPKKDIDARARGEQSIMPTGLADPLTIHDFASLLAYLESLKSK